MLKQFARMKIVSLNIKQNMQHYKLDRMASAAAHLQKSVPRGEAILSLYVFSTGQGARSANWEKNIIIVEDVRHSADW